MKRVTFLLSALSLCILTLPGGSDSANILGFFAVPSKSHSIIHCSVADTLAKAGHNVTVIGALPDVIKNSKYKYIHIDLPAFDQGFVTDMINKPQPIYKKFGALTGVISQFANDTLVHPTMQKFLREHDENSFDLIILGYFFNDAFIGLGGHFKCPIVISFMVQPILPINLFLGNPSEEAYVPILFGGLKQPMNFWERVMNYLGSIIEQYPLLALVNYHTNKLYSYNFPSNRYPPIDEVKKNVSLVFSNHHFSQGPIRPNVPSLIEIGGIQIKEKPDPLPVDIAQILDNEKKGVIYFSLGSNVQGTHLSPEKARIMFNVLSKLPYKVLWKWGDSDFPGIADNIIYKSWLPQDDILAHPNVKLFITHGGQGSVVESQYHGVPMVGIPLFADQPANMESVKKSGFGLSVDYISLTEESFRTPILEVIENPKYSTAVKQFSTLYRDRPMTPRQLVVFWTDYVLRHNGAKHLQSPVVHMNWWQLKSLDVIAFIWTVIAVVIGIFVGVCRFLCCRKKKTTKETKKVSKSKKNK